MRRSRTVSTAPHRDPGRFPRLSVRHHGGILTFSAVFLFDIGPALCRWWKLYHVVRTFRRQPLLCSRCSPAFLQPLTVNFTSRVCLLWRCELCLLFTVFVRIWMLLWCFTRPRCCGRLQLRLLLFVFIYSSAGLFHQVKAEPGGQTATLPGSDPAALLRAQVTYFRRSSVGFLRINPDQRAPYRVEGRGLAPTWGCVEFCAPQSKSVSPPFRSEPVLKRNKCRHNTGADISTKNRVVGLF